MAQHSSYPPGSRDAADCWKFSVKKGGLGIFWSTGGAGPLGGAPNLGGAEEFDEFCKNLMEKI